MNDQTKTTKRIAGLTALVLVFALAMSSVAIAQDSSVETYGGDGDPTIEVLDTGGAGGNDPAGTAAGATADAAESGSLPFTGMDVGLAAGGALLLIGMGLALSRLVVRENQA